MAASTQNQALCALLFLYRQVLGVEMDWVEGVVRAKRPQRLPVVLSRDEVKAVLAQLRGTQLLMGILLYGAGLRLMECMRLRVKDVDFTSHQITVRDGHDIRTLQELLGHRNVNTTMIYTHVLNRGWGGVRSPADRLMGA